jgi:quinolinate synthase
MTLEEYQRSSDDELYKIISRLKEEQDAVFLVHNYQVLPVQRLADFIGDSLALAQAAVKVKAKTIVFCGVHFMAESAKLLNPEKTVLLPDTDAGCPMADMVTPEALRQAREKHNNPIVVTYVNSTAAVKAESDICCTSSNAVDIINSLPADREILFVPDKNLGAYAAKKTGRKLILWPGHCYVHNRFTVQDVINAREEHPGATVMVHPECPPEVIEQADMAASTSGMVQAVKEHPEIEEWVIGTEQGLIDQLAAANPQKGIYPLAVNAVCRNMKMITLAKAAWALENQKYEITVPAEVAEKARLALERMLEVTKQTSPLPLS